MCSDTTVAARHDYIQQAVEIAFELDEIWKKREEQSESSEFEKIEKNTIEVLQQTKCTEPSPPKRGCAIS